MFYVSSIEDINSGTRVISCKLGNDYVVLKCVDCDTGETFKDYIKNIDINSLYRG